MSKPQRTLSILMPLYNETATVGKILEKIRAVDLSALNLTKQIIVIDDGSTDGGPQIVADFLAVHTDVQGKLIRLENNTGKGNAIHQGLAQADGEFVIIQDADLEYNPEDWRTLLAPLATGETPVVFGSRQAPLGPDRHKRRLYQIGLIIAHAVYLFLYGHRFSDVATCYKAMRTDLLRSLGLERKRFDFCVEVADKLLNRGIVIPELPVSYNPRYKNEGKKIRWQDFFEAMYTIVRYRFFDPTKKR